MMKSIIHVMSWNHEEPSQWGLLPSRLQLYVTRLRSCTQPCRAEKKNRLWHFTGMKKRRCSLIVEVKMRAAGSRKLRSAHIHTGYIHPARALHPPLLDVAVTWCNSRPGWLPWVLVSQLNGLPQQASKAHRGGVWRAKRVMSDWGDRGGV